MRSDRPAGEALPDFLFEQNNKFFSFAQRRIDFIIKPLMDRDDWLSFISHKLRSQISLDNAYKAQTWALAFVGLLALGFALNAVSMSERRPSLYPAKVLFLALYHLVLALAFYLPGLLQKGRKPVAGRLGVRDFTGLIVVSMILCFYSMIVLMLSAQITGGMQDT